jgi:hypothetical protein
MRRVAVVSGASRGIGAGLNAGIFIGQRFTDYAATGVASAKASTAARSKSPWSVPRP